MEFQGISVVIIWHEGEGDQKRGLHSTHLLQNTPLLSHVSISFGFLTGLWRHFVLESDLFLWPDVGLFFLRRWIWTRLLWFDFVDINWDTYYQFSIKTLLSTATPQRSPEGDHGHVLWSMNGVYFATETYRTGFQEKDQGEDEDSQRKSYLFPKIFVTNLQFDQVRFFFNVTEVSIFLLFRRHTSVNQERTQMVWRGGWKHPTRRHSRNGSST